VARNLSIGSAWTEAAAFVRNERKLLAPVVLGLVMVPGVIASMVQPDTQPGNRPEPGSWMIVTVITLLAMVIGQMAIALLATGWRGSVGAAIGRAARRLPTLVLAGFVIIIPMFIALTLIMLLSGVKPGVDGQLSQSNPSPATALMVLLFLAALFYLAVRLLPLVPIVANSDHGAMAALKRSFAMTRGKFWKLLGFLLLLAVAFLVAGLAISAVVGTLVTLAFGRPEAWSVSLLLMALVGGLLQAAFITIYTVMLARIAVQLDDAPTSGT
jgi:hypothetical protein